jgi:membrane-associated phospholipid phosphatase
MLGIGQHPVIGSSTHPPAAPGHRTRWRHAAFAVLLAIYAVLTVLVVVRNGPTVRLDEWVANLRLKHRWPGLYDWINFYIHIGQRAPSTAVALPWILWRCWRLNSKTPFVRLVAALLLLNLSVGVVKVATGRIGPHKISHADVVFAGGNIYPSGHVSNIVVLLGVLAWMSVRYRKVMIVTATILPVTVGFSTIYLNMHWLSDVVAGWLAGGLVLLALPTVMPTAGRIADALEARLRAAWLRRQARRHGAGSEPSAARPVPDGADRPADAPNDVSAPDHVGRDAGRPAPAAKAQPLAPPIMAWRRPKPAAVDLPAQAGANPTYHAE